ncbi:MAG: hypothetical protein K2Q20_08750 [Phycisphaerales bacterium]|nr:hypothetical protein [Phycisphaerales bacterium]
MAEPSFANTALQFGAVAGAAGIGTRLLKHILDVSRDRDISTPVTGKRLRSPISHVPIDVTPEEAELLSRQGINVKSAGSGLTGPFFENAALGALGTAAAAGGWKLSDWLVERKRKADAAAGLDRSKQRVERLLADDPLPEDVKLAGFMRACEDEFLAKNASIVDTALDYTVNLPGVNNLGYIAGPAALLGLARAYQNSKAKSQGEQKAREISSRYVDSLEPETPVLTLQPVVRRPTQQPAVA